MNPWPVIVASLSRYRYSAMAFIFLIVAGTALSVGIISQERALRTGSAHAAEKFDVVVAPVGSRVDALLTSVYLQPGSSRLLSPEMTVRLLNDSVAAFVSPLAFGDSYQGAPIVGVSADLINHLADGVLAEGRVFTAPHEAVVGAAVAVPVGGHVSPSHGVYQGADGDHAEGHDVTITVVGRMPATGSPWDRAIAVPVEMVWNVHGLTSEHANGDTDAPAVAGDTEHDSAVEIGGPYSTEITPGVPAAVMKARTVADAYRLRSAYNTDESMAFFPAEVLIQLYKTLGDMREIMTMMAFVTQGLVMLAIIASVLILFRLLMPQFVTLRAIGAPRLYIFAITWGFVAVLFTIGVVLGVAAGYALSLGISTWLQGQFGLLLRPSIGRPEILLGLGVWVMGLALAVLPGWQLQRKSLAHAMHAY